MALDRFEPVKTKVINGRQHKVESRECSFCHKFFETTFVNARYCNRKCKNAESSARDKNRRMGVSECLFCGREFGSGDKRRKFCSPECRENMRKD